MNPTEAEQALAAWASVERDELVRSAHQAGVSKNRIHAITGIARTTIDRILEPTIYQVQTDRLTDFLRHYTAGWPRQGYLPYRVLPTMASTSTANQIADELFADAAFRALKLGTFLNTPDGRLLVGAAEALAPPLYREDIALLVEALQLAAKTQQQEAVEKFLKGMALAIGAGAVVAALAAGGN